MATAKERMLKRAKQKRTFLLEQAYLNFYQVESPTNKKRLEQAIKAAEAHDIDWKAAVQNLKVTLSGQTISLHLSKIKENLIKILDKNNGKTMRKKVLPVLSILFLELLNLRTMSRGSLQELNEFTQVP